MEKNEKRVTGCLGADHFVIGAKLFLWAMVILILGSVGGEVLKHLKMDGGVMISICKTIVLTMGLWAIRVLATGDRDVTYDPERNDEEVDRHKFRYSCFNKVVDLQGVALAGYIVMSVLLNRVSVKAEAFFGIVRIVGECLTVLLIIPITYMVCMGFAEYADRKSTALSRWFIAGSVFLPICNACVFAADVMLNLLNWPKALIFTCICIGTAGMMMFIVLLAIFADKYREDASDPKMIRKTVARPVLLIGLSLLLCAAIMVVLKISLIKAERKTAADHYLEKIAKSDEPLKGYDDYWVKDIDGFGYVSTMEELLGEAHSSKNKLINVPKENIKATGISIRSRNFPIRYIFRIFDNMKWMEKYGQTTDLFIVTMEDGKKLLCFMPSYVYDIIMQDAVEGRVTFPMGGFGPSNVYRYLNGRDLEELDGSGELPERYAYETYTYYMIDESIRDRCVTMEKAYACLASLLIVLSALFVNLVCERGKRSYKKECGCDLVRSTRYRQLPIRDLETEKVKTAKKTAVTLIAIAALFCIVIGAERICNWRILSGRLLITVYDKNENEIYYRSKYGTFRAKYNEAGEIIKKIEKDDNGTTVLTYEYDDHGNVITETRKGADGYKKTVYERDDQGRVLSYVTEYEDATSNGRYEYDKNGNCIYTESSNSLKDEKRWTKYTYNANDKEIRTEYSDGHIYTYEYDENGNLVLRKRTDGSEPEWWERYTYNEKGVKIRKDNSDGDYALYNDHGDVYYRLFVYSDGTSRWYKYEYEYDDNNVLRYSESIDEKGILSYNKYNEHGDLKLYWHRDWGKERVLCIYLK